MVGCYYILHCGSGEFRKATPTPSPSSGKAAGILEWRVHDECCLYQSTGENEGALSEACNWILTKQLPYR